LKGHAPSCVLCFRYVVHILVIDHDSVASYIFRVTEKLFCTCTHVYTNMLLLMMLRTMNSWEYEGPQNFRWGIKCHYVMNDGTEIWRTLNNITKVLVFPGDWNTIQFVRY